MLDSVTKRRIDTCRDILVGKIPDPKSQVEQITIALIYKFMDDMDLESEELGGERKFFTGEFERYAWGKLVAPGTSGQDMLNTYGEALQRMTENEKLPSLFRDIFRNAYLPYRDPETLRSFLREIDGFTYDHSERLGDAFEYLLSVLGSQGDAGQFRTPRHIIDFMVAVIDPVVALSDAFDRVGETLEPATLQGPVNYIGLENISQSTGKLVGNVQVSDPTEIKSLKGVFRAGDILYGKLRPNLNKVWLADRNGICSTDIFIVRPRDGRVVSPLYSYLFRSQRFNDAVVRNLQGAQLPRVSWSSFENLHIPLPPIDVQREIVAEIEDYQKVIDGARTVLENYRPHIIIDPEWPKCTLGDIAKFTQLGLVRSKAEQHPDHPFPYIKMNNIKYGGTLDLTELAHVQATVEELDSLTLQDGDFLYNTRNSPELVGKSAVFHGPSSSYLFNNNILRIRFSEAANPDFVNAIMRGPYGLNQISRLVDATTSVAAIYQKNYLAIQVPLPNRSAQDLIVAELEAERALVEANRELIRRMEARIEAAIARIWGDAEQAMSEAVAA